jgi:hypothetical protein
MSPYDPHITGKSTQIDGSNLLFHVFNGDKKKKPPNFKHTYVPYCWYYHVQFKMFSSMRCCALLLLGGDLRASWHERRLSAGHKKPKLLVACGLLVHLYVHGIFGFFKLYTLITIYINIYSYLYIYIQFYNTHISK